MTLSLPPPSPRILFSSAGRAWHSLHAALVHIPGGLFSHVPGGERHRLGMHFGPSVNADCSIDGRRMRRVQKPGDVDFIPAGMDGAWQDDGDCQILRLELPVSTVRQVAEELGRDAEKLDLMPRFQLRDVRLQAIGWAIKADLEANIPSDPLYIDLLANALAVRLIETATDRSPHPPGFGASRLSARQFRMLTEFIETHLDHKLHLADLAATAGVGATRLKALFRNSAGTSLHQYVIRRRVEYARALIATTTMPAAEIALAAGFAHQSHMASTMRRILGQTPGEIARPLREIRPKLKRPV